MVKRNTISDSKFKTLFEGPEPGTLIQYFKDDTVSGTNEIHSVAGKGVMNNRISAHLMTKIESIGIPTHFIRSMNMREQLVKQVDMIPIELRVRNIIAGDFAKRLGLVEGATIARPLIEYYYKGNDNTYELVSDEHIISLGWADPYELEDMVSMAWRINDYLNGLFAGINVKLIDFKIEFGRIIDEYDHHYLILADDITPENCRLWDATTSEQLDPNDFTGTPEDLISSYQEIACRLGILPREGIMKGGDFNEQLAASLGEIENELARHRRKRGLNKPPRKY